MLQFSVLDLCPIVEGGTAATALNNARSLAQLAERAGFKRYWLAEHHNMSGIASAATSVVIGHVAGGTSHIRVGSGGVMLPNHAPLVIAEQFGTLEALYPGRIDLGLGRAPGTDMQTAQALRRNLGNGVDTFPRDVLELKHYFETPKPEDRVQAVPGAGLKVPLYILGSSTYGAQLAAMLGLPFAFASHFAPDDLMPALAIYRERFQPSEELHAPHAMVAVNIIAAASDEEARRLFTSQQQAFVKVRRGERGRLPPPIEAIEAFCSAGELMQIEHALSCSFVGAKDSIVKGLTPFLDALRPDELIVNGQIFDFEARLRSFEIAGEIAREIAAAPSAADAAVQRSVFQ